MLELIRKHKLLSLIITNIVIYVIQFILLPNCFPQYYPISNESTFIFIVPLVFLSVAGNVITNVKIKIWALVDVLYGVMLCIYNGMGFYGIGMRGVSLDGMSPIYSQELAVITILMIVLTLFAFQSLICVFRLLFLKAKKK